MNNPIDQIMKIVLLIAALFLSLVNPVNAQQKHTVEPFDKVIISPNIQVTFKQASKEQLIEVIGNKAGAETFNIESKNGTLHLYLEGARFLPTEKTNESGWKEPIYKGTVVIVTVYYQNLNEVSIRGEETVLFEDKLQVDEFALHLYGSCKVNMKQLIAGNLAVASYGESQLHIEAGNVDKAKYTCYGESTINALPLVCTDAKVTLFGESNIEINVESQLKLTSFGESKVTYKGNPETKFKLLGETQFEHVQ